MFKTQTDDVTCSLAREDVEMSEYFIGRGHTI